jgi:hypothetical protein
MSLPILGSDAAQNVLDNLDGKGYAVKMMIRLRMSSKSF